MFGKRRRVDLEGSTGVKDPNTRQHRRLKNEKTAGLIFEKTFRMQIAKWEDGSSVRSLKIKDWTLWRGWPPAKWRKTAQRGGASNVEVPTPTTMDKIERTSSGASRDERT
jgi:hypothetical protein